MKKILLFIVLLWSAQSWSQLTVNIMLPPSGVMDKQQLWNIIATNTESTPLSVQVQLRFSEVTTGLPVFTAMSSFVVNTGTKQLSATTIDPVQYNILNADYGVDPGPAGLLPIGTFMVCYDFQILKFNKVVQECQQVTIPSLGPILLSQPSNGDSLSELYPSFSWLPPSPVSMINNLRYEMRLVEMLPNQSVNDAMQDNITLLSVPNLITNNFQYNQSSPALQPGKQYAWQIIAFNGLSEIGKSDAWHFITRTNATPDLLSKPDPGYIKLGKAGSQSGYAVFWGNIRFDYLNETTDSTWHVLVEDLTAARHSSFTLAMDSVKLRRGQNIVSYDAAADSRFKNKHQYLLTISNSRKQVWQLRFEYRKPD